MCEGRAAWRSQLPIYGKEKNCRRTIFYSQPSVQPDRQGNLVLFLPVMPSGLALRGRHQVPSKRRYCDGWRNIVFSADTARLVRKAHFSFGPYGALARRRKFRPLKEIDLAIGWSVYPAALCRMSGRITSNCFADQSAYTRV